MDDLERLIATEAIRTLKATYWYALDTKDWDLFASTLTEDAVLDLRAEMARTAGKGHSDLPPLEESIAKGDEGVTVGATNIVEGSRAMAQDWITYHLGGAPVITVTGPDTAKAIWPFFDYLDDGTNAMKGYSHYHDRYRKVRDRWLISYVSFLKIRSDGRHPAWEVD